MARLQADRANRSGPPARQAKTKQPDQERRDAFDIMRHWPAFVIVQTYRYLSEGARVLGKAYTTYDDLGP